MSGPDYILERWPHGWLLCAADGRRGIPMTAMQEAAKIFPKRSFLHAGICHHYRETTRAEAVAAVMDDRGAKAWAEEINQSLEGLPPQLKWWRGLDVGASSASIFVVLADPPICNFALHLGRGNTPMDLDDLGRCRRLLKLFDWEGRLAEVAAKFPASKWPAMVARWAELEAASPMRCDEILRELR